MEVLVPPTSSAGTAVSSSVASRVANMRQKYGRSRKYEIEVEKKSIIKRQRRRRSNEDEI